MMSENHTEKIKQLIAKLTDEDSQVRGAAREELVEIGGPEVTNALMLELLDTRPFVRWEAAKGLIPLRDDSTAASLLHAIRARILLAMAYGEATGWQNLGSSIV